MLIGLLIFSLVTALLLIAYTGSDNPLKEVFDIYLGILGLFVLGLISIVMLVCMLGTMAYNLLTIRRLWK
jgi:cell division protein FtsX